MSVKGDADNSDFYADTIEAQFCGLTLVLLADIVFQDLSHT